MNATMRRMLVEYITSLDETAHYWRDHWGRFYGMAPDAIRKIAAVKAFVEAHGWRVVTNYDCITLAFDRALAESLHIPAVLWPEDERLHLPDRRIRCASCGLARSDIEEPATGDLCGCAFDLDDTHD